MHTVDVTVADFLNVRYFQVPSSLKHIMDRGGHEAYTARIDEVEDHLERSRAYIFYHTDIVPFLANGVYQRMKLSTGSSEYAPVCAVIDVIDPNCDVTEGAVVSLDIKLL